MNIFPAIDLYGGKAVRLYKGDYTQMTVYSDNPVEVALQFRQSGARFLHLVDLEGAKSGKPANRDLIHRIVVAFGGFVEVGGGIRTLETIGYYLSLGIDRVILGTAAVTDPDFLSEALAKYGKQIAVGVDLKDGYVAIRGWTEKTQISAGEFFGRMEALGVQTVICTDISKDGAMQGTNRALYRDLSQKYGIDLVASGGVSDLDDIKSLAAMNLYGAIVGKAYYIGAIDIRSAIEVAR